MSHYSYIDAIGIGFPNVQCHVVNNGDLYTDIIWDSGAPLPSQQTLDEWIAANANNTDNRITVLAFRNRFTQEEKISIDLASIDNPTAPLETRVLSASLRVALADLATATFIDLSDPRTIAIIQALAQNNIITAERGDEILNTPILPIERLHV